MVWRAGKKLLILGKIADSHIILTTDYASVRLYLTTEQADYTPARQRSMAGGWQAGIFFK